ncbi:MAG: hypothetical protein M0C28_31465 [Candidatus Moduliflexus flocculans]|nr:hypothetical protein [Candidatus Moduliflexus flocculans]
MRYEHAGNFDGNYINNSPFPATWKDLSSNNYNLAFNNFNATESSGANGNNTQNNPSLLQNLTELTIIAYSLMLPP